MPRFTIIRDPDPPEESSPRDTSKWGALTDVMEALGGLKKGQRLAVEVGRAKDRSLLLQALRETGAPKVVLEAARSHRLVLRRS